MRGVFLEYSFETRPGILVYATTGSVNYNHRLTNKLMHTLKNKFDERELEIRVRQL